MRIYQIQVYNKEVVLVKTTTTRDNAKKVT